VGALTTWSKVSAGHFGSLAVKTDGTLWAWGNNGYGQLGLGDITHRSSPVQVGALTTWSSISAGYLGSAAIKTDGTLWAWGNNENGQVGDFSQTNRSSPVQVSSIMGTVAPGKNWSSVVTGWSFKLGIIKQDLS